MKFCNEIQQKIKDGIVISDNEILTILANRGDDNDLTAINLELATALWESTDQHLQEWGYTSAERAWIQSGFSKDVFPVYLNYLEKRQDIEKIRTCYKQLGLDALYREHYSDAIKYFNLWQYCYNFYLNIDKYEYDFVLLDLIEKRLAAYKNNSTDSLSQKKPEKIRVAYLVSGLSSSTSIVPKMLLTMLTHHDFSHFEISVFTTETYHSTLRSSGRIFINQFKELGCKIYFTPHFVFENNKIFSIAKKINSLKPHILVTFAALADFEQFFIFSLKPAPVRIGFVLGSPAQFISPSFDYGISWINHIILDCPVPCLNSGITHMPKERPEKKLTKADFGIPEKTTVLISSGRYVKFQDVDFLRTVTELLKEHPDLHYIIIGPTKDQIPSMNTHESEEIKNQIHIFEWNDHYEDYLSIADIYIDTYPSGGGITLYDAAILRLPIISFRDDYSHKFDQSTWNPAEEIFPHDSIILINRGDFSQLKSSIRELYQDHRLRIEQGNKAYDATMLIRHRIGDNVKKIESLYTKLVHQSK